MNYAKNKKYLGGNDTHYYIGLGLVILGVLLFMLGEMMWIFIVPYQLFVASFLALIGALLICIPSAGASNEEEIDKYVKDKIDTLTSRVTESMPKSKNQTQESPTVVGNYIFDKEDIIIRKGRKDGKYRSSLYSAAVISYKKESVYIHQCTFSLVSDVTSENVYDIPFSEKPEAAISEETLNLNKRAIKIKRLNISDEQGTKITIPVINSVLIDEICDKLNTITKRYKA